jgi:hypothetical protein
MRSLLRTTALVSVVLAFTAPHAAAGDAKLQTDYRADGNVDLMAAFERLRMLDEIGEVTVVKLQPGQLPASADPESDKTTVAETSDTADAAAEIAADGESDPPPLKWSALMYAFWQQGGRIRCRGRDTSRKRSSRSYGRLMFSPRKVRASPMRSARSASPR